MSALHPAVPGQTPSKPPEPVTEPEPSSASLPPEELFLQIFRETFQPENAPCLYSQYHFSDICQNDRYVDFLVAHDARRTAIEIVRTPRSEEPLSLEALEDLLLRENSMSRMGWDVYRWAAAQLERQPERVKEELKLFLGEHPRFQEIADYLPPQRGKALPDLDFNLQRHQIEALSALAKMRSNHETIALLYHATGTGKTVTAVMDAMRCGKRTLFLAHTRELVEQAFHTFTSLWPEATVGLFLDGSRQMDTHVVCGSVQSVVRSLNRFSPTAFPYLIIDEAHHATSDSYQQILSWFRPSFTLGLTATPERADGRNLLEIFRSTAHRLDIRTAVELGELTPVRCFRIHTNIDFTQVRFHDITYTMQDLETRLFVPARNRLIVNTWLQACRGRRTVIFCVSVRHAREIARLFREQGVSATAVSGGMAREDRAGFREKFRSGEVPILCACDLLNEGWDCPEVEVLFFARPTMSKVLYTQQLGRGMRKAEGKDFLMVFDFVDNCNRFNAPYTLHRLFHLSEYRAGAYAVAPARLQAEEARIYEKGDVPPAVLDWPVDALDYELVDLFNWQEQAEGMISQTEFSRRVDVQPKTVRQYLRQGRLIPDLQVPISSQRTLNFFTPENLQKSARQYGWTIIDDSNRKDIFLSRVRQMSMNFSYKPVLLKAIFRHADATGRAPLSEVVTFFCNFYEDRRKAGLVVEAPDSLFVRGPYTRRDVETCILAHPFRAFESMQMLRHSSTLGFLQVEETVWDSLTPEEKEEIVQVCEEKLASYFRRDLTKRRGAPSREKEN